MHFWKEKGQKEKIKDKRKKKKMSNKYDHKKVEAKWQKYWLTQKTFKSSDDHTKPKYYVLDMFPYPSGSGLHVGHVEGYTATDILARYKRQCGFNVLHPMGWDSFGLPAEQYAIRTGTHPSITTEQNIANFRRQLRSLGFSYDWDREFATSEATYYKWTQWIFTKLYEKGLAYEADLSVNYCPALGTVLANEEIENGCSKEGGYAIERRPLRQWVLKITAYAERLLKDLEELDWPESLKKLQINWIGKSEGASICFNIQGFQEQLTIFTTCPDTLSGVTFMVLAPEHPLVDSITTFSQQEAVSRYRIETLSKSDLERTDLNKNKTGVFTGAYAINPLNSHPIPIWIADYVMMGYGTGAIMAVPAHDERDFEFAKRYHLAVLPVYHPAVENYPALLKNKSAEQLCEEVLTGQCCWLGEGSYIKKTPSALALEGLSAKETRPIIIQWLESTGYGKAMTHYKLRDWLFSRQRYWGEPFPLLHLEDGTIRLLEENELPLIPPEITNYKPTGDGRSPLVQAEDWVHIVDSKTGKKARRETHTMPQWAGSCWYYLRFCDPQNRERAWDPLQEKYWMSVDMYIGGVEHAVLHLLYARFWHKVLYDCGLVSTIEPFKTLRNQGMILARSFQNSLGVYINPTEVKEKNGNYTHVKTGEILRSQVEKMSKSKLNGVTPDEIIEEFGADSLRLYEMFMGPLEKEKVWNTDAVSGCRRFLNRVHELAQSEKLTEVETPEALKLGHRLLNGVIKDIEALQFNTAIAKMMEFINDFTKLSTYPRSIVKLVAQLLLPFAPHLAEEVGELLGHSGSLSFEPYPAVKVCYLEDEILTYVVQINGKVRGKFELPKDQEQQVVLEKAKQYPIIAKYLEGVTIDKVIFVPNKLLNLVTH